MRIGILSTANHPMLGDYVDAFAALDLPVAALLLDQKTLSEEQCTRFVERTGGRLPARPLETLTLPDTLRVEHVSDHNGPECLACVDALKLDLLINGGTPRIIKSPLLAASRLGILNCHPGLLPQFRGCTCVEWAVFLDEPVGSTAHFMTEGIDDGPIVLQEAIALAPNDCYEDLRCKVYRHGPSLLARAVGRIMDAGLTADRLPPQGEGVYRPVIPADKLQVGIDRLAAGEYRYQNERPAGVVAEIVL